MSKSIQCPNCENETPITDAMIGKQIVCPFCKQPFWVKKSLIATPVNKPICFVAGFVFSFIGALATYASYKEPQRSEALKWAAIGLVAQFVVWVTLAKIMS